MTTTARERSAKYRERHEVEKSLLKYTGVEGIDYVECKICGKRGLYIDSRHLKTRHGMTKEEYVDKFPSACIISESKRFVQINNAVGNKSNTGKKFTKAHRKKIAESQKGANNSFYGRHHSKATLRIAKKKREKTLMKRYGVVQSMHIPSVREKMSRIMADRIVSGGMNWYSKCSSKGHFFSVKNNRLFFYRSSWELRYMQMLESDDTVEVYDVEPFRIEYVYEGIVRNYIPDFFVNGKHIVEVKPKFMLVDNKTKAKINAGMKFADRNGFTFDVVSF